MNANADESDDEIKFWDWKPFIKAYDTIQETTYDTVLAENEDPNAPNLIPRWARHGWPSEGVKLPPTKDLLPQEGSTEILKGDTSSRLRPALLPKDEALKPTRYALRYGVFPDDDFRGPQHGRSRMSPMKEAFEHEFNNLNQGPGAYTQENIANFRKHYEEEEVYADDEDYQRAFFLGFTTQEVLFKQNRLEEEVKLADDLGVENQLEFRALTSGL